MAIPIAVGDARVEAQKTLAADRPLLDEATRPARAVVGECADGEGDGRDGERDTEDPAAAANPDDDQEH